MPLQEHDQDDSNRITEEEVDLSRVSIKMVFSDSMSHSSLNLVMIRSKPADVCILIKAGQLMK
jgi:hypothetical protein